MKTVKNSNDVRDTQLTPLMTLVEVAEALGISRSMVWQIERNAFKKIRSALARQSIYSAEDLCP